MFTTLPGRSDRASLQVGWKRGGGRMPFFIVFLRDGTMNIMQRITPNVVKRILLHANR